ncbi:MAG: hypothetical protein KAI57_04550 [Candidatus Pacebacteria bacterium]|nr:hypothetical protein [Candidatus Paceibacterota bacterium]
MEQKESVSKNVIQEKEKKKTNFLSMNFLLLFILIAVISYNQININSINKELGIKNNNPIDQIEKLLSGNNNSSAYKISSNKELTGDLMQDSIDLVISKGVPEIYGEEMGVTFDEVQSAITLMKKYDPYDLKPKGSRIIPQGDNLQRYIDVTGKISCEYCCSATSIINPKNGRSACGCAHSMAMRGLAAYLIQYHPEMSNDEILRELALWKGLYFPKQMIKKMAEQLQNGNYTPDTASLVVGVDLPDYGEGSVNAPLPSEIENLPGMVGGC